MTSLLVIAAAIALVVLLTWATTFRERPRRTAGQVAYQGDGSATSSAGDGGSCAADSSGGSDCGGGDGGGGGGGGK